MKQVLRSTVFALALLIIGPFVLPSTLFARYSPLSAVPEATMGTISTWPYLLIGLVVIAVVCLYVLPKREFHNINGLWVLVLIYVITYAVGAWDGGEPRIRDTIVLVSLASGLLVARLISNPRFIVPFITVLGTLQALYALYQFFQRSDVMVSGVVVRAGGTFNDPNALSVLAMIALPFAIAFAYEGVSSIRLAVGVLSISTIFAVLILTWARGAVLGAAIGMIWFVWRQSKNRTATLVTASLMLIMCLAVSVHRTSGPVNALSSGRSLSGRVSMWKTGTEVFMHHWSTGIGVGASEIPVKIEHAGVPGTDVYLEPKNLYLHWLDELGLAGGILLVLLGTRIAKTVRRRDPISIALSAAWIMVLVAGLFDTPFGIATRTSGNAIVGLLLGLTLQLGRLESMPVHDARTQSVEAPQTSEMAVAMEGL